MPPIASTAISLILPVQPLYTQCAKFILPDMAEVDGRILIGERMMASRQASSTVMLYASCLLLTIASSWGWVHLSIAFGNIHHLLFNRLDAGLEGHLFHLQVFLVDAMLFATGLFALFMLVGWLEGRLSIGSAFTLSAVLLLDRLLSLHFLFTNEYYEFRWYARGGMTSLFGEMINILSVVAGFALAWLTVRWLLVRLPRPPWQSSTSPS